MVLVTVAVLGNGFGVGTDVIETGPITQLAEAPTAIGSGHTQLTKLKFGSVTLIPLSDTSPSLETVNLYHTFWVGMRPTYLNQFVLSVEICLFTLTSATGSPTTSEAEAVLPLPPSVDVTTVVVLFAVPAFAPVTVTVNVQLLFATSDPPEKDMVWGAVVDSEPLQVAVAPLVPTVRLTGKVSVNPTPESELDRFGLAIVKDKVEVLPVKIEAGEKDLSSAGGAIAVSDAVA